MPRNCRSRRRSSANKGTYKLFGVVTNRKDAGDQVIWWLRERCGKSEEVHSVMKTDLAGGQLPSGLFGANAAWWALMILAHNLNTAMKRLVLGKDWATKRMKALRFRLIGLPGRVVSHARKLIIRLGAGAEALAPSSPRVRRSVRWHAGRPDEPSHRSSHGHKYHAVGRHSGRPGHHDRRRCRTVTCNGCTTSTPDSPCVRRDKRGDDQLAITDP